MRSHDDLHANPRYRLAVEFFFNELYGAGDARRRDADLIKVQTAMERLLPREGLEALCLAIQLETLTQELDADVARALRQGRNHCRTLRRGVSSRWTQGRTRTPDRVDERSRRYLDGVVRKPIVRGLVRLARRPAHAAGFGQLQEFLERGLDAFETMHGAGEFLSTIREREMRAMARMFAGAEDPFEFEATRHKAKADTG